MTAAAEAGDLVVVDGVTYVEKGDGRRELYPDKPAMYLKKVQRARSKVVAAQSHQRQAMIDARGVGASTREIARAAGVSHTQVQRILRSE